MHIARLDLSGRIAFDGPSTLHYCKSQLARGFKQVTFRPHCSQSFSVAALSLSTHREAIEHAETAGTQALSDDTPSLE
ncbi:hypothetical protein EYF80_004469 [Liparis tanakae]|uniref:Uncharacterized protein n=1 Tax=Liparis tanakae TaxID=230148 RepID=A0A4Z2J607_9TELE|nr:hypothetical protein EYF80_004469 [Liparis tanakae]